MCYTRQAVWPGFVFNARPRRRSAVVERLVVAFAGRDSHEVPDAVHARRVAGVAGLSDKSMPLSTHREPALAASLATQLVRAGHGSRVAVPAQLFDALYGLYTCRLCRLKHETQAS